VEELVVEHVTRLWRSSQHDPGQRIAPAAAGDPYLKHFSSRPLDPRWRAPRDPRELRNGGESESFSTACVSANRCEQAGALAQSQGTEEEPSDKDRPVVPLAPESNARGLSGKTYC